MTLYLRFLSVLRPCSFAEKVRIRGLVGTSIERMVKSKSRNFVEKVLFPRLWFKSINEETEIADKAVLV
jgi:hypothetical protein